MSRGELWAPRKLAWFSWAIAMFSLLQWRGVPGGIVKSLGFRRESRYRHPIDLDSTVSQRLAYCFVVKFATYLQIVTEEFSPAPVRA
jgi:hypothetical protein